MTVAVDAVVYYKIYDATMSITKVENASRATRFLAQTTLRNVLGTRSLSEILSEREAISHNIQVGRGIPPSLHPSLPSGFIFHVIPIPPTGDSRRSNERLGSPSTASGSVSGSMDN